MAARSLPADIRPAQLRAAVARSLAGTDEVPEEIALPIRGAIPAALRGVLYRNGPGRFGVGEDRYQHLFDGDGLVHRIALGPDGARYRSRFVRTEGFLTEEAAGRMLYRGYGTDPPGGPLRSAFRFRFKNTANTALLLHGGELLALWEGGTPYALDPDTLHTRGRQDFNGALRTSAFASRVLGTEPALSAHPRTDHAGRSYGFGVEAGPRPRLHVYALGAKGGASHLRTVRLPATSFVHDFVVTPRFFVFLLSSIHVDVGRVATGQRSLLEAMHPTEDPVIPLLVPRHGGRVVWGAPLGAGFAYHLVNGFEHDGQVVVDALWMDRFEPQHFRLEAGSPLRQGQIPRARIRRLWIEPDGTASRGRTTFDEPCELPAIDPRREGRCARYTWLVAASDSDPTLFSGLARVDLESGATRRVDLWPHIAAEPVYIPHPALWDELAGWLALVCTNAETHRSTLCLLSARSLRTLAEIDLPTLIPPSFHGLWAPEASPQSQV